MSKWYQNFIEKIAKANNKNFQGKKLDCCELNQDLNNNDKNKAQDTNNRKQ